MYDLVVRNLSFGGHLSSIPGSITNRWPAPGMPFCFPITQFTFWEIGEKRRNSTLLCGLTLGDSYIKDTSSLAGLGTRCAGGDELLS